MTYRMGWKYYTLTGVSYGVMFGAYMGFQYQSWLIALIVAPVSGLLFGFLMCVVMRGIMEKRFMNLYRQLAETQQVICHGPATIQAVQGWLYVTENEMIFIPRKAGGKTGELHIPMNKVGQVTPVGKTLVVETVDHFRFEFSVMLTNAWKADVDKYFASRTAPQDMPQDQSKIL